MNCPCGKPLHYTDPIVEEFVTSMIDKLVVMIKIRVPGSGSYWVSRHYLALHGIKDEDLPELKKRGVVWEAKY